MDTWDSIWLVLKAIRDILAKLWSYTVLIAPFFAACGVLWGGLTFIYGQLDAIPGYVSNATGVAGQLPGGTVLSAVNRFVPLSEYLMFLTSIMSLRLLALVIRIIKSLIPTYG